MSYYSLDPSELQSLQFLFVFQLFFCGVSTCPRSLAESVISSGMSILNYPASRKKQPRVLSTALPATGERYCPLCNSRYMYWSTRFTSDSRSAFIKSNDEARKGCAIWTPPLYELHFQPVVSPFQFLLRHSFEEGFARP